MVEDEGVDVRTADAGEAEGEEDGVARDVAILITNGLIVIVTRDAMIAVMLVTMVEDFHRKHPLIPNHPQHRIVLDG